MRLKVVIASALACFVIGVSSAQAFQWHMTYAQAKRASWEYVQETCEELEECTSYAVGKCYRRSPSHFACIGATFYAPVRGGESELECNMILQWGVNSRGVIVLKRRGEPYCFAV
jgi:hypothetical protein